MHAVEDFQDGQGAGTFDVQGETERTRVFKLKREELGEDIFVFYSYLMGRCRDNGIRLF